MSVLQNKIIQKQFNRFASIYDTNCSIQTNTGKELLHFSKKYLSPSSTIIDLGCGTGSLTKEFFLQNSFENCIALDNACELIKIAAKNLKSFQVKIISADFNAIPLQNEVVDIAFSNMALHWSPDISITLNEIHRILSSHGMLIFSLPIQGTFHQLQHAQDLINESPHSNNFLTREKIEKALKNSHYQLLEFKENKITLEFENIYQLIHSFKCIGAGHKKNSSYTFRSKNYFSNLEKIYRNQFTDTPHQKLPLTYSLFLGVARKCINIL